MALNIAGMSPLLLDTTELAIQDLEFTPDIVRSPFRHSGNEFPSVGVLPGGRPSYRYKTPFAAAYTYFGLKLKISTAAEIYFATFASGLRQAGANHSKLALNTSAKVASWITGASVRQNGILMADVTSMLLSSDGVANPLVFSNGNTLPVLAAEPQLNTMGPISRDGTRKDGAANHGFSNNCVIVAPVNDGDKFPRNAVQLGAEPKFMIEHQDPIQMLTDLGLEGENITTSIAMFYAGIDPTTGKRQTTGVSLTATLGHRYCGSFKWSLSDPASVGIVADLLSISATHPIAVNLAATLP